jgi:uncharacterized protein (TIGR00299 family) protein
MSRILYFDCFSGIAGDIVLGALLDAGLPLPELKQALGSLAISDYEVTAERVLRAGVSATRFRVHEAGNGDDATGDPHGHDHHHGQGDAPAHHHPHRHLKQIFSLIDRSGLSAAGRDRAKELFQRLGEAEAAIHQMPIEKVHLHEVGALDSIIDIVGAVFALEWVGADRIVCSPLNVGGGTVHSAHGLFPVPAPATVKLLGDAPIYSGAVQKELVTPTGALIATSYANAFGPIPQMAIEKVGYGAGERDNPGTPNVLRVFIGRAADRAPGDRVVVIECEIDDMNPQIFGVLMDRLLAEGALDVFYTAVQMKKNRPGTLLTIIAPPAFRERLTSLVFGETTSIGVRYREMTRECLERETVTVHTTLGPVRMKVARRSGRVVNASPEFDDCARVARERGVPIKDVQAAATKAYLDRGPGAGARDPGSEARGTNTGTSHSSDPGSR